jgi:hypothetical protein
MADDRTRELLHRVESSNTQLEVELTNTKQLLHDEKSMFDDFREKTCSTINRLKSERDGALAEVEHLREELKLAVKSFADYRGQEVSAGEKNVRLRQLARNLENAFFLPWISRSKVAKQIDQILDGKS